MRTDSTIPGILIYETNELGYITSGTTTASFPTTASKFAVGCVLQDSTSGKSYRNAGTVAVPVWRQIQAYATIAADTNGTQSVNVIDATVPFSATIKAVQFITRDAVAGTITVSCTGGTVATIVKGTSVAAGTVIGAQSLGSTAIAAGNTLTFASSTTNVAGTLLVTLV